MPTFTDRATRTLKLQKAERPKIGNGLPPIMDGFEGENRIQMVDGNPRLYYRANNSWYFTGLSQDGTTPDIPTATSTRLGLIKIGSGGTVSSDGTYTATAATPAADDITGGDAAVTISTSSGNITIDAAANNSDIIFKGTDATSDITMLTLDGSDAGHATFNNSVTIGALLIMPDVTNNKILVSDGTSYQEVALSGDATIANNGPITLAAAQTNITSIYATDLIMGEDSQTAIDFGTANEIDFKVDNAARLTLTASALYPVTDNQIDLGTSSLEFKDAFFDGTVTADAFAGPLTGNVTGTADVATVATTVTITANESTNESNAIIFTAGGDVDGGNLGLESDGTLTYNPSTGKITATGFIGALTGNVTGDVTGDVTGTADTATVATTVTITDNESTNETNAVIFTAGAAKTGGNLGLESDGDLTYNPSSGTLAATAFTGALTGNVTGNTSGTAATVTGAAQSAITSLGTLTTLTVDNVIVNGTTIGHTDDTDLLTVADAALTLKGTLTVGVDDTGHDVKFFGASAGAYMEWDESADQLRIMGASADATTSTGKLLLATSLTDINANDVIGKIDFQAPHEAGGTDAITVAASIQAIAQGTFSSSVNATDLIFYTGHSEAATEKVRITSQGEIGIGGANYGSDGQVLTSAGAGAAVAWEDAGGGGGLSVFTQYRLTANITGTNADITSNWALSNTANQYGIGDGSSSTRVEESSGIFTFPSTGYWWVMFRGSWETHSDSTCQVGMYVSTDNGSSYTHVSNAAAGNDGGTYLSQESPCDTILKVENVSGGSTVSVKFTTSSLGGSSTLVGWSTGNNTTATFVKVGDV